MTGCMQIMDARRGHETVLFAREGEKLEEGGVTQEEANARFDELVSKGYLGFSAQAGQTGTQLRQFDPEAEELLMVPPMVGG